MGLSSWVGGYMREHGSLKLGGGIYERTWVSQAGWGGYTRDHGFLKLGGRIYERTWVSQARWGDIQETMGLLSWVGEYMREHGSPKLGGGYMREHRSSKLDLISFNLSTRIRLSN